MPTYEYECTKCSHRFEVFQAMSDEPVKKCPECGKQVRRLVSGGIGVIFKGSGFYVTDKDKANPKSAPKGDGVAKAGDGSQKDNASKTDGAKADSASKGGDASSGGDGSKNDATPKADTDAKADGASKVKGKAKPAA